MISLYQVSSGRAVQVFIRDPDSMEDAGMIQDYLGSPIQTRVAGPIGVQQKRAIPPCQTSRRNNGTNDRYDAQAIFLKAMGLGFCAD